MEISHADTVHLFSTFKIVSLGWLPKQRAADECWIKATENDARNSALILDRIGRRLIRNFVPYKILSITIAHQFLVVLESFRQAHTRRRVINRRH
jgi:hypothetical protein